MNWSSEYFSFFCFGFVSMNWLVAFKHIKKFFVITLGETSLCTSFRLSFEISSPFQRKNEYFHFVKREKKIKLAKIKWKNFSNYSNTRDIFCLIWSFLFKYQKLFFFFLNSIYRYLQIIKIHNCHHDDYQEPLFYFCESIFLIEKAFNWFIFSLIFYMISIINNLSIKLIGVNVLIDQRAPARSCTLLKCKLRCEMCNQTWTKKIIIK